MFRVFKKFDRNGNGTLDFSEYTQCLAECPNMELSKNDIVSLAMSADLNGDGVIDFEEFMRHYTDFLDMLEFNRNISKSYQNVLDAEALSKQPVVDEKAMQDDQTAMATTGIGSMA